MRLVAVLTRPDDDIGHGTGYGTCAGTAALARYVAAGYEVMVVAATGDEDLERHPAVETAIEILGVGYHWLGFTGGAGDLPAGATSSDRFAAVPIEEPTERLVRVLREFRPHIVVTYDIAYDETGYTHPDHVRCHDVSVAAFDAAADPGRFPAAGEPWQPLKLQYLRERHEDLFASFCPQ